jgi:hypothetical protein
VSSRRVLDGGFTTTLESKTEVKVVKTVTMEARLTLSGLRSQHLKCANAIAVHRDRCAVSNNIIYDMCSLCSVECMKCQQLSTTKIMQTKDPTLYIFLSIVVCL